MELDLCTSFSLLNIDKSDNKSDDKLSDNKLFDDKLFDDKLSDDKADTNIKIQLINILKLSKINHKIKIMNEKTIKDAHIYCKINNLSGQVSGPLIEYFIKQKYNMIKNSASLCIGDLKCIEGLNSVDGLKCINSGTNIEIKMSNGGKDNKFNYVQIRMNHECDYLFTAYNLDLSNVDNLGELFLFKLTKNQLKPIILKYGNYAHGTIKKNGNISQEDLDNKTNSKEYSLRPKYNDDCWKMLLLFKIDHI